MLIHGPFCENSAVRLMQSICQGKIESLLRMHISLLKFWLRLNVHELTLKGHTHILGRALADLGYVLIALYWFADATLIRQKCTFSFVSLLVKESIIILYNSVQSYDWVLLVESIGVIVFSYFKSHNSRTTRELMALSIHYERSQLRYAHSSHFPLAQECRIHEQ